MLYKKIGSRKELTEVRNHMADVLKGVGFNPSQNSKVNEKVAQLLGAKDWNTACGFAKGLPSKASNLYDERDLMFLGLSGDATEEDIKGAFEELAVEANKSPSNAPVVEKMRVLKNNSQIFEEYFKPTQVELNLSEAIACIGRAMSKEKGFTFELGAMNFKSSDVSHEFSANETKVYGFGKSPSECYSNILSQATSIGFSEESFIVEDSFAFGVELELSQDAIIELQIVKLQQALEDCNWSTTHTCSEHLDLIYYQKIKELSDGEFRDIEVQMTLSILALKDTRDWRKSLGVSTYLNDGDGSYDGAKLKIKDDVLDLKSLDDFDSGRDAYLEFKLDEVLNNALRLMDDNFL